MPPPPQHEVIVIGAGFAGICMAIRLRKAGIRDFVILERAGDIGGTWRDNRYPGVAVDIPSVTYQFSFAQNGNWRRVFAKGAEVKEYADSLVAEHGLRPHVRLGQDVVAAEFDAERHCWLVRTAVGDEFTARFLVSAHGVFGQANTPDIEGVGEFAGRTVHTLHWDQDYAPVGERVAVIGTGASSVQLVPELAREVERLDVYQRTPIWVMPRPDVKLSPRARKVLDRFAPARWASRGLVSTGIELAMWLGVTNYTRLPFLTRRIEKLSLRHLRQQVSDPGLRERLTPGYDFGCKRPALSNHYWSSFEKRNVELVTDSIKRIHPHAIETADGTVREIDTLVLATGFKFFEYDSVPGYAVRGEDGVDLRDWWAENRFQAYEGITVPGFPNLFLIPGPHFATSWSWLVMAENQTAHALRCITHAREQGATYVGIRRPAHDRFYRAMRRGHRKSLFTSASCADSNTYYLDRHGEPSIVRPQSSAKVWWRARHFPLADYEWRRPVPDRPKQPGIIASGRLS